MDYSSRRALRRPVAVPRQHRQTQQQIDARDRPLGANPPGEGAGPPVPYFTASFPLSQWECPRRAASAPPPAQDPGFRVPGPQRGESVAGGRGPLACRRRFRPRRQLAGLPRSLEVKPRVGELQLRPAGGLLGRPLRPERAGLPGVGSERPPRFACPAATGAGGLPRPPCC